MQSKFFLAASAATIAIASGFAASPAAAQSTGEVTAEQGQVIVVTGATLSRGVEGIVVPDTSKAKETLTQEQLAHNIPGQTVLDSLNIIPGVTFTNNDAYGSAGGQLSIRGFSADRISLTFDGVPLNDTGNYAIYSNQQLDPELIEQVSVNLGSTDVDSPTAAATGSTVNYRTRLPKEQPGVQIVASAGEYNMFRLFGAVDSGAVGPWGTRAFVSASRAVNDVPFNGFGVIDKSQFNARIYQPIGGNGDFISVAGNYNQNRNNFFGSLPLRTDLTQSATNLAPRVVGPSSSNRFPISADERDYSLNLCQLNVAATPGVADLANSCGTEFDRRFNPSNTGSIRGSSKFHLADTLTLTVDPSFQWVMANGGGTATAQEGALRDINPAGGTATTAQCRAAPLTATNTCVAGYLGGTPYFGRDINGDGDLLDTVTVLAPSNTRTHRYGVIANLIWDVSPNHSFRVAYTYDYGRHRQTGEVSLIPASGQPYDYFGVDNPQLDATGATLEKRDRLSFAKLQQVSGEYRGKFFDARLRVNAGIRSPWFTRDLNNHCFTSSDTGFVECFGSANDPRVATYAALNPTIQGPQERVLKYHQLLPNAGLVYDITDPLSVFANYAKGLQVPGTDALYNAFFFAPTTPSAHPQAETSDNFDAGLRWNSRHIQGQVVGWYTKYTNRLASAYDPETDKNVYRNLGAVDKYGIDANIGVQPIPALTLYAFGSYLVSKIKDDVQSGACTAAQVTAHTYACTTVGSPLFVATAGNREAGAPAYTYGVQARGTVGPVELGVTAKRTGGRFIYDSNLPIYGGTQAAPYVIYPAKTPAYWLVNLDARVGLQWLGVNDRTFLQFNVYNLFNQLYVGNYTSGLQQGNVLSATQFGGTPGSPPFANIGAPRTISASINVEF